VGDARRLGQLEVENTRLKRLPAEDLDNAALNDLLAKNWRLPRLGGGRATTCATHACSERRACGLVDLTGAPRRRRAAGAPARARREHRRVGDLRLHALLRQEGW
jgi:hypothetical protein